jgi:hypothetical protein
VKNNLNQSKTNNESNFFTNNNDINIYLTKYIFNKKKTRNRENNIFFNKKTFNLSSQKYDMNGSINVINNTYLNNNTKNYIFNKNFFIKSRNKIPSCHKGRPNTIINKNKNLLVKKSKEKKKNSKDKKDLSKNLKSKRRNYSMIGYNNIININLNNINQNLTDRDNMINIKDNTMNKSPNHYSKNARHNKVLSGIYINLSNLGNIVKKEINSERNAKNNKNSYIRIMNQNQSNYTRPGAFLRHNAFYKAKQSFLSSHSVSKSKSNIKNNKKNKSNKNIKGNPNLQQKRNKSNFSNTLIDDLSKLKKISNKPKKINIENYKKGKKLSKDIGIDIFQKKIVGRNQKNSSNFGGGIIINNNEKITGALTSRTRNLKTYNIFFKTNSIDIDKIKIIDINNNKENCNTNRRQNNNKINNSNNIMKKNFINLNDIIRSKKYQENHLKKISKITILKNNIEKASNDNNIFVPNGLRKISNENKNLIKYK